MLDTTIRQNTEMEHADDADDDVDNENSINDMNTEHWHDYACLVSETGPILYMFLTVINVQ